MLETENQIKHVQIPLQIDEVKGILCGGKCPYKALINIPRTPERLRHKLLEQKLEITKSLVAIRLSYNGNPKFMVL